MSDELTWLPAWQMRQLIEKREVSCAEVTDHFLNRIEEFNPILRAFEEVDVAGAKEQAKRADAAVAAEDELGPLHGIPTAVKSHIPVKGMKFTQGTSSVVQHADDISVERLRSAGAVIIGTNTMLGAGVDLNPANRKQADIFNPFNWEAEALSPWDLTRVPGWSSSGGAAAVAAGLLPVAIGTDGGGSTRLPAAYSGIVGLHTSRGLIPHVRYDKPEMMLTSSLGPLARSVRDAAIFTRAMSGGDGHDFVCIQDDTPDPVAALDQGVNGMKMAWTEDFGYASIYASEDSARIIALAREAAQGFLTLGASIDTTDQVWEDRTADLPRSRSEPGAYEVFAGGNRTPLQPVDAALYNEQADARARNWSKFRALFNEYDVLLSVTAQRTAAKTDDWDRWWTVDAPTFPSGNFGPTYCSHTMIFNWLGFPAVSVPCGFIDGLPVGLQIAGWFGREDVVLRVAQAFQQAFPRDERPPTS